MSASVILPGYFFTLLLVCVNFVPLIFVPLFKLIFFVIAAHLTGFRQLLSARKNLNIVYCFVSTTAHAIVSG